MEDLIPNSRTLEIDSDDYIIQLEKILDESNLFFVISTKNGNTVKCGETAVEEGV